MLSGNDHAPDTPAVAHGIVGAPATTTDDELECSDDSHGDGEENPRTTVKPIFVDGQYTPIKVDD
jgi:hypothetical protein